ncbi:hypothetical protein WAF17_19905 [Bernardetia sp. ABR2-2B]|uniref:hypothetical protein n=1 Tax=Bernardetia sp. ABR2-2B TaxID=3127472 RepID=UPI0030CA8BAD
MKETPNLYRVKMLTSDKDFMIQILSKEETQKLLTSDNWKKIDDRIVIYENEQNGNILNQMNYDEIDLLFYSKSDYERQNGKIVITTKADKKTLYHFLLLDKNEVKFALEHFEAEEIKELRNKQRSLVFYRLSDKRILVELSGDVGELFLNIEDYYITEKQFSMNDEEE